MKKVGLCQNCGRSVYTNDIDLCKRCYNEVGLKFLNIQEAEEGPEEEETPVNLEELGIASEQPPSEVIEEEKTEEVKEEEKKE